MKTVMKVLTALAAIAGVVYVVAAYGDKIVATCKKLLAWCSDFRNADVVLEADFVPVTPKEAPVEEATAEEAEESPAEETTEAPIDETAPVADEEDFEG